MVRHQLDDGGVYFKVYGMTEELKIIDFINHKNKYAMQHFIVLNRNPEIRYERRGDLRRSSH